MKNERGVTLLELLATLVLVGVIIILFMSIFLNGLKTSKQITTKQELQQEANYIIETVRKEYLKSEKECKCSKDTSIVLEIDKLKKQLKMNSIVISEGYDYDFETNIKIPRIGSPLLILTIQKNDKSFHIETKLSKLE